MKQRRHRKAVQRRMRNAPSQYDLDCVFYGGHRWTKRDRKLMAKRRPVMLGEFEVWGAEDCASDRKPLEFNRIHSLPLSVIDTMADRHAGLVVTIKLRPYQQAVIDALDTGTGWALVDGTLEGRAASRAEFMRDLTADALYKAMTK